MDTSAGTLKFHRRVVVGVGRADVVPSSCVGAADGVGIVGFAVRVFDASADCVAAATEADTVDDCDTEPLNETVPHDVCDTLAQNEDDTEDDGVDVRPAEVETVAVVEDDALTEGEDETDGDVERLAVTVGDGVVAIVTEGEALCDGELE
jgi:hypothetical protein